MFPEVHAIKSTRGPQPYLSIVNEPENKFRFRYTSETGSHGGLLGKGKGETSGKKSKKTYPTVKLENYHGKKPVIARVSLYTLDKEKHVLELKGKTVKNGMSYEKLDDSFEAKFNNLVIVNKKKDEVHDILMKRKIRSIGRSITAATKRELEKKFSEEVKRKAKEILSSVLLCFEAFLKGNEDELICTAIFSEPIHNQKSSLKITRISRVSGSWRGGDEVILLCDKVKKGSIKVLFFEDSADNEDPWDGKGVFLPADIHHQVAITFKTPPYKKNIEKAVNICLSQEEDKSESVTFTYIPDDCDLMAPYKKRKRQTEEEFQDVFENVMATPSSSSNDASSELPVEEVPFENSAFMQLLTNMDNFNVSHLQKIEAAGNNFQDRISEMGNEPMNDLSETETMDVCANLGFDPSMLQLEPIYERMIGDEDLIFDLLQGRTISSLETDGGHPQSAQMSHSLSLYDRPDPLEMDSVDSSTVSAIHTSSDVLADDLETASVLADDLHKMSLLPRAEMACNIKIDGFLRLHGETSNTQKLLDRNDNANYDKISASAQMDEGSVLKFLPRKDTGRDVKTRKEENRECRKLSKPETLEKCFERLHWRDNLNNTVLHWAVFYNKNVLSFLKMDERLDTNIVNVQNRRKQTVLHIAAKRKNELLVQLLLKYGANPNLKDVDGNNCLHITVKNEFNGGLYEIIHSDTFHEINAFNYEGLTPIHLAVIHQSAMCFRALVTEADLNVSDQKSGKSLLHFAIEMLPSDVAYLLEQDHVDVNSQDFSGNTPLHLASAIGNLQLVELLLKYFADPSLKNFKQGLEITEQENSDNETTDAFNFFNANIEEISTKEIVDGQTPMDVATDPRIREVLEIAIQKRKLQSEQLKCSNDASEMSKSVIKLCNLLDEQLDIAAWKNIVECMGMDGSQLDIMLKCSSPSPSKAVLNYLQKKYGQKYMEVFQNLLGMAGLNEATKLVKEMCI